MSARVSVSFANSSFSRPCVQETVKGEFNAKPFEGAGT
jgi:hypothetical protein